MNFTNETILDVSVLAVDIPVKIITAIFGAIIFLFNLFILVYLLRLLTDRVTRKQNVSLWINLFSVCINDTLCGLTVFVIAVLYVDDITSIYVCANIMFFALALQNASQGNIMCISVQRYVYARNLRSQTMSWQPFYTKTLLVVNFIIAAATVLYYLVHSKIRKNSLFDNGCNFYNVVYGNVDSVATTLVSVGMPFLILSDILCILTVHKLRANVSVGQHPGPSSSNDTGSTLNEVGLTTTNKLKQQKAIATIILIIVSFNLSYFPSVFALILKLAGGIVSADAQRVLFMSVSINSFFNPVIIAVRTQTMRTLIKRDIQKLCQLR